MGAFIEALNAALENSSISWALWNGFLQAVNMRPDHKLDSCSFLQTDILQGSQSNVLHTILMLRIVSEC